MAAGCGAPTTGLIRPKTSADVALHTARPNSAVLPAQLHFARRRIEYSEIQQDGHGVPTRGFRARGTRGGSYWFTPDARLTRFEHYLIVRDYGVTLVFDRSELEIRDNASNLDVNVDTIAPEPSDSNVASTLRSGHIAHRSEKSLCPECLGIQIPSKQVRAHKRAPHILINQPVCDSQLIDSCDSCLNVFSVGPCCDLAAEDCSDVPTGSGGAYYDDSGNLINGSCAGYAFDAELYGLCLEYGLQGPQLTLFRGAGVRSFKWYTAGASRLEVNNPFNGPAGTPTFGYYNLHVYDLIAGNADTYFQPINPLTFGLSVWCFDAYSAPTPFESETVDVVPVGFPTKSFTARLARIVGGSVPQQCP